MGPHKSSNDEERRALSFAALFCGLKSNDRFGGNSSVGIIIVVGNRSFECSSSRKRANGIQFLICEQSFLASELAALCAGRIEVLDHFLLEMRDAERQWIAFIAVSNVKDLTKRFRTISVCGKVLRQRDGVRMPIPETAAKTIKAA